MSSGQFCVEYRVLLIDDTPSIHKNYQSILAPRRADPSLDLEHDIFGTPSVPPHKLRETRFLLDSAYQGREALEKVEASLRVNFPYAMAFVDVRMPPGWDGMETISRIWAIYPDLEVVIATAYSDKPLDEIFDKLQRRGKFLILKKPFDSVVVLQMAYCLTEKWDLRRRLYTRVSSTHQILVDRTKKLETLDPNNANVVETLRNTTKALQEATRSMREISQEIKEDKAG